MWRTSESATTTRVSNDTNALNTINAAASAIAASQNRVPQASIRKRRWGSCWSVYWCFGSHRHRKRIGHAVLVPESSATGNDSSVAENPTTQGSTITFLPFVAPPSSPASFLQSEPPSASQSPAVMLSRTSASMYSPSGPSSIFAIGPYAHETQLVSPPVFSTFTTEPSTAPFTPPPESVHLTTPSSPEVPFAHLLDPGIRNVEAGLRFPLSNYEFQSYQLYPGSPIGQLISPSSGISGSGASSPFADGEFSAAGSRFLEFQMAIPPKLLNLDKLSTREWGSRQGSGSLTPEGARATSCSFPLNRQFSDVSSKSLSDNGNQNDQVGDHRITFFLPVEGASRCVGRKLTSPAKVTPDSKENGAMAETEQSFSEIGHNSGCRIDETSSNGTQEQSSTDGEKVSRHQKHRSLTLGSLKEFDFDNADGVESHKPNAGPDWWANESDVGKDDLAAKNWSFFPVLQPSVG
ncbi:uncharacterized protein LOC126679367 [Mercurialis annua]|uniref:uncharacterized protein LOC126679367 n=1 Tax=Mercurialis annua TaxID=3986 RepID=UPI00215EDEE0|nr:uncharacterized protein LOC126679367 [Mercurialis annua]